MIDYVEEPDQDVAREISGQGVLPLTIKLYVCALFTTNANERKLDDFTSNAVLTSPTYTRENFRLIPEWANASFDELRADARVVCIWASLIPPSFSFPPSSKSIMTSIFRAAHPYNDFV